MTEPFEVKMGGVVYRAQLPPAKDRLRASADIQALAAKMDFEGCWREVIRALVDAGLPREPLEDLPWVTLAQLFEAYTEWTEEHLLDIAPDPRVGPSN